MDPATPPPTTSVTTVRVRYAEVDRMGYLWHGHYLAYFEEARTDWLRARGTTYRDLEDAGTLLVVVESRVRHHRPALYDDVVTVHTHLAEARGPRLTFAYEVRRGDDLLASGHTLLACADRQGRPCRPPPLLAALARAAAGTEGGPAGVPSPGPVAQAGTRSVEGLGGSAG